ncbi:hypothetical protein ACJ73_01227 [Blastomyces percursus]|uniref:rRNA-processing protein EBP2 n=1 Tax=Blastomyces percursus TaxID=1658174 RepID=A0A1J9QEY4_9EURO|nr:hypothetical protein ACJ73_01227 [Blastomyces percursus]
MVKKSKLLSALDAHKGRNYELERQKKLQKAAERRKRAAAGDSKNTLNNDEEKGIKKDDPTSPKQNGTGDKVDGKPTSTSQAVEAQWSDQEEEQDEDGDEDEEDDIPLSELSEDDAADVIPHQRLTINNSAAILSSLKRISFFTPQTPFSEHNSLTSTEPIDIPDPNDDLTRELAFYTVCVSAAKSAREQLKKEGIPFSRPTDYFAEMVKSDEHMGRVKKKLFDEAAAKKASAEAKRQRDLKKFGKQVQIAKLQQRQKEKRETLDKINSLKRKRKASDGAPTEESDLFDVTLEDESKSHSRGGANKGGRNGPGAQSKRQKKDQKFGFGGKKRFAKSGDAISSGDLSGFSVTKMKGQKKGGAQRPGKSRRAAFKRA